MAQQGELDLTKIEQLTDRQLFLQLSNIRVDDPIVEWIVENLPDQRLYMLSAFGLQETPEEELGRRGYATDQQLRYILRSLPSKWNPVLDGMVARDDLEQIVQVLSNTPDTVLPMKVGRLISTAAWLGKTLLVASLLPHITGFLDRLISIAFANRQLQTAAWLESLGGNISPMMALMEMAERDSSSNIAEVIHRYNIQQDGIIQLMNLAAAKHSWAAFNELDELAEPTIQLLKMKIDWLADSIEISNPKAFDLIIGPIFTRLTRQMPKHQPKEAPYNSLDSKLGKMLETFEVESIAVREHRVDINTTHYLEQLVKMNEEELVIKMVRRWRGLLPGDSLILAVDTGNEEIFNAILFLENDVDKLLEALTSVVTHNKVGMFDTLIDKILMLQSSKGLLATQINAKAPLMEAVMSGSYYSTQMVLYKFPITDQQLMEAEQFARENQFYEVAATIANWKNRQSG